MLCGNCTAPKGPFFSWKWHCRNLLPFFLSDFDEDDPLAGLSLDEDSVSEAGKKPAAKKAAVKEQRSLEEEPKAVPPVAQPGRFFFFFFPSFSSLYGLDLFFFCGIFSIFFY